LCVVSTSVLAVLMVKPALGGQFRSRLPVSLDVESREHFEQGERTFSKEGCNRPCRMKLEFFTVQFDESRDTIDDTELRA
jgi:hypothetical protein